MSAANHDEHNHEPIALEFREAAPDSPLGGELLDKYFAELRTSLPGGFDDTGQHEVGPGEYYLAALYQGQPIGYCGFLPIGERDAEIKKLWIDPAWRHHGVAGQLLDRVEGRAADSGFERVFLDTSDVLTTAVHLYERRGYQQIPRYNDNPNATLFFAKQLSTAPEDSSPEGSKA